MSARAWYVIACEPQQETRVKGNITRKAKEKGQSKLFGKILTPREKHGAISNSKYSAFDTEGEEIGLVWAQDHAEALWKAKRKWDGEYREVRETVEIKKGVTQTRIVDRIRIEIKEVVMLEQGGKAKIESDKVFPGYIFVQMEYNDDTFHTTRVPYSIGLLPLRPKAKPTAAQSDKHEAGQCDESTCPICDYNRWKPKALNTVEEAHLFVLAQQKGAQVKKVTNGDMVRIEGGPYKGGTGKVRAINGSVDSPTIWVEITVLGRSVNVPTQMYQLTKV